MNEINRTPLTLTLAFLLVLGLLAGVGIFGITNLRTIDQHLSLITNDLQQKLLITVTMRKSARERSLNLHRMILLDDPFEQDEEWLSFNRYGAIFSEARERLEGMPLSAEEHVFIERHRELINENVGVQVETAQLAMAGDREGATRLLVEQALPAQNVVFEHLEAFTRFYEQALEEERRKVEKRYQEILWVGWFAGGIALALGIAIATWTVWRIRRDQEELRLQEQEQRGIIDSMMTGVLTFNERGTIQTFNPAACDIFGYQADEIIGKNINLMIPDEAHSRHEGYMQEHLEDNNLEMVKGDRDVVALRKGGERFPMRIMLSRLPTGQDGLARFIASCIDVSEQREQEIQLRSSQKMEALGKLTGGIAHDYNNMLGVILGYAQIMRLQFGEDENMSRYIKEIEAAGERARKLTERLLAFSRQKPQEPSVFDVCQLLYDDQLMLEKTLTASVELSLALDDQPCMVRLDRDDLGNAILNICINARHAMPYGGRLQIATSHRTLRERDAASRGVSPGEYVEVMIRDSGVGMDDGIKSRIFDPFFSTKGEQGTGLGLSQVYGFVQRSGGGVLVDSMPGEGTAFYLYFPAAHVDDSAEKEPGAVSDSLTGKGAETILVVDDEPRLRKMIESLLKQQGYEVLVAEGAEPALELLESHAVDLLLSDVVMPEVDGIQLATLVSELYPKVIIQLMSGYSGERDHDAPWGTNMLQKPFDNEQLLLRIRTLLDAEPC